MSKDQYGKLIPKGHGQLDTRGTFGLLNQDAHGRLNVEGARQGYDITSIDISDRINFDQKTVYIQGQTLNGDEDYTIGALGLQLQVDAPIIQAIKAIDDKEVLSKPISGQTVNISIRLSNEGTRPAKRVIVNNLLQQGLAFVPGSFKIDGRSMPDRYAKQTPIGEMEIDDVVLLEYQAIVEASLLESKPEIKSSKIDYLFSPRGKEAVLSLTASTNPVTFTEK